MRKKKLIALILAMLAVFSIISITSKVRNYAENKSFKMIYLLQEGESCESVARRFGVKVEDLKIDGRYVMFEVK